jgi:hypothetical protein
LLAWHLQPGRRDNGWDHRIENDREAIEDSFAETPGLKQALETENLLHYAWRKGRRLLSEQIERDDLPALPIWSAQKILDPNFLP